MLRRQPRVTPRQPCHDAEVNLARTFALNHRRITINNARREMNHFGHIRMPSWEEVQEAQAVRACLSLKLKETRVRVNGYLYKATPEESVAFGNFLQFLHWVGGEMAAGHIIDCVTRDSMNCALHLAEVWFPYSFMTRDLLKHTNFWEIVGYRKRQLLKYIHSDKCGYGWAQSLLPSWRERGFKALLDIKVTPTGEANEGINVNRLKTGTLADESNEMKHKVLRSLHRHMPAQWAEDMLGAVQQPYIQPVEPSGTDRVRVKWPMIQLTARSIGFI